MDERVRRNGPCPCGSGEKYKRCCGNIAARSFVSADPGSGPHDAKTSLDASVEEVHRLMHAALAAQVEQNLPLARDLYDRALSISPTQPDALHMRGVVALAEGDADLAVGHIEEAVRQGMNNPSVRHNLGLARRAREYAVKANRLDELAALPHCAGDRFVGPDDVQLLAYFLPQFHAIPENDAWWSPGFTEWTNVRRARPNFQGHDQPRVPGELGYYDLLDPLTRAKQASLARQYGVNGFCYYHYWFHGRRVLEKPLDIILKSREPDFPFCIFWANENWTKNWDGGSKELLIEQTHSVADDIAFIEHLLPFFADHRYIRVAGRPLLMIYRIDLFPDARRTIRLWQEVCRAQGVEAPYLVKADTKASGPPEQYGADASVEFPPHRLHAGSLLGGRSRGFVSDFSGTALSYRTVAAHMATAAEPPHTHFRTVVPGWDNTARRQKDGTILVDASPELYRAWLRETICRAQRVLPPGRRLVFINAWNEWAEGAYLEPDQTHGRAMLEATLAARFIPKGWTPLAACE